MKTFVIWSIFTKRYIIRHRKSGIAADAFELMLRDYGVTYFIVP